jgi:hypothetical protein
MLAVLCCIVLHVTAEDVISGNVNLWFQYNCMAAEENILYALGGSETLAGDV